jgi:hypothetical protein
LLSNQCPLAGSIAVTMDKGLAKSRSGALGVARTKKRRVTDSMSGLGTSKAMKTTNATSASSQQPDGGPCPSTDLKRSKQKNQSGGKQTTLSTWFTKPN